MTDTTTVRLTPSAAERFPDIGPDTPGTVVRDDLIPKVFASFSHLAKVQFREVSWNGELQHGGTGLAAGEADAGERIIPRQDLRPEVAGDEVAKGEP